MIVQSNRGGQIDLWEIDPASGHAAALTSSQTVEVPESTSADGRVLKRLRLSGFAGAEAVTMIAPTERGMLGEFRASGYATFLARPVRGETLLRVLLAALSGKPVPVFPASKPGSRGRRAPPAARSGRPGGG